MDKEFIVTEKNIIDDMIIVKQSRSYKDYKEADKDYDSKLKYYKDLENKSIGRDDEIIEISLSEYIYTGFKKEFNKIFKRQQFFINNDLYLEDE